MLSVKPHDYFYLLTYCLVLQFRVHSKK